jgi:hypothetical protein
MQTFPPPNLPATHRPTSLYPERRMARNRRPVSGARKQSLDCPLALLGPLCVALRGRIGNRVYKTYGEKIIITRVPRFDGYVPSAAQRERRDRMRAATAFAQSVYADPAAKAVYVAAAKSLGRQPFRLAVSDFLHGRTRIPPFVPCMAPSPETPADLAQGSHAADVQRRGSRELTPAPQPGPAAARVRRSRRVNMTRTPSPSRRARFAWLPFARPQERHLPSAVPLRGHSPFTAPFPQGQHRRKEQAWSRAGADSLPGPTAFRERVAVPNARTPRSDLGSGTFWEST